MSKVYHLIDKNSLGCKSKTQMNNFFEQLMKLIKGIRHVLRHYSIAIVPANEADYAYTCTKDQAQPNNSSTVYKYIPISVLNQNN